MTSVNPRPVSLALAAALGLSSLLACDSQDIEPTDEAIPWRTDVAAAIDDARRQGKPVWLYFTADW